MEGIQQADSIGSRLRLNLGLAGPAMIHLQHEQEARQLGVEHVERVRANLTLLKEYFEAHPENQDLEDWLGAWEVAEAQSTGDASIHEQSLHSVAQILDAYVDTATKWKATIQQLPN